MRTRKLPQLPKKVRRALTVDQSMDRYLRHREAVMNQRLARRWRLARVEYYPKGEGPIQVLQVAKVWDTPDGVVIIVR